MSVSARFREPVSEAPEIVCGKTESARVPGKATARLFWLTASSMVVTVDDELVDELSVDDEVLPDPPDEEVDVLVSDPLEDDEEVLVVDESVLSLLVVVVVSVVSSVVSKSPQDTVPTITVKIATICANINPPSSWLKDASGSLPVMGLGGSVLMIR